MKREPITKEIKALFSCLRARLALRDERKEKERRDAGVIRPDEIRGKTGAERLAVLKGNTP